MTDMIGMIDLRVLFQQLKRYWWLILLLSLCALIIGFMIAIRPIPYEAHATVSVEPKVTNAAAVSFKDIEIEMGRIRSWTTVERVLDAMPFYGRVSLVEDNGLDAKLRRAKFFLSTGKKHRPLMMMPIRVEQLVFPSVFHGQRLMLEVLQGNAYKVSRSDGSLIFKGKTGVLAEHKGIKMLVGDIAAELGTQFHITPLSRESMIESVIGSLKIRRRTTNKYTSLIDFNFHSKDPYFAVYFVQGMLDDYLQYSKIRTVSAEEQSLASLTQEQDKLREALRASEHALDDYLQTINVADVEAEQRSQHELRLSHEQVLRDIQFQKAQLKQVYTSQHPAIKAVHEKEARIVTKLQRIEERLEALSSIQGTLLSLNRSVEEKKQDYMLLNAKIAEIRVTVSSLTNPANIINKPRIVRRSLRNKAIQVIALGGMMGFILACGFVVLRTSVISSIFRQREQLGDASHVVIFDISQQGRADFAADVASELSYLAARNAHCVMMVSCCTSSPAASNVALKIAKRYARKEPALLIDADTADQHLAHMLGKTSSDGFANLMSGEDIAPDSVARIDGSTLFFMPSGNLSISQILLRDIPRIEQLLEQFGSAFPCIVMDVPPLNALHKADELFAMADMVIHVIEMGTPLAVAQRYLAQVDALAAAHPERVDKLVII